MISVLPIVYSNEIWGLNQSNCHVYNQYPTPDEVVDLCLRREFILEMFSILQKCCFDCRFAQGGFHVFMAVNMKKIF